MKLLYIWVNCSRNKFIKEEGFNISGEYFWVYDAESKVLAHREKQGYIKGFWGDQIDDLTVIAGTNASGKTTLLSELMECDDIIKDNHNSAPTDYHITQEDMKLIVFEYNKEIFYDHNLGYEIKTEPFVTRKSIHDIDYITKIYVSNSTETGINGVVYNSEGVSRYALTDLTISTEAKTLVNVNKLPDDSFRYYKFPPHFENCETIKNLNNLFNIDSNAYEDIDTLIKLFFLVSTLSKQFIGKKYNKVSLYVKWEVCNNDEIQKAIKDIQKNKITQKNSLLNFLLSYFYFKLEYFFGNAIFDEIKILDIDGVNKIIINIYNRMLEKESNDEEYVVEEYFLESARDILLFDQMIKESELIVVEFPDSSDLESYEYLQIDLKSNEFFDRLFHFFNEKNLLFYYAT